MPASDGSSSAAHQRGGTALPLRDRRSRQRAGRLAVDHTREDGSSVVLVRVWIDELVVVVTFVVVVVVQSGSLPQLAELKCELLPELLGAAPALDVIVFERGAKLGDSHVETSNASGQLVAIGTHGISWRRAGSRTRACQRPRPADVVGVGTQLRAFELGGLLRRHHGSSRQALAARSVRRIFVAGQLTCTGSSAFARFEVIAEFDVKTASHDADPSPTSNPAAG